MLELWYQALRAKVGIRIQTDNLDRLKSRLYIARRDANDPDLGALILTPSPIVANELWIVHKSIPLVEEGDLSNAEGE